MAIIYNQTLAQARLQAFIDAAGTGAKIVVGTSALSGATGVLASFTLTTPIGTLSVRTLTLSNTPKTATASAGGIAAKAEVRTSADVVVASGLTVGAVGSACDIIIDTTAIVSGRTTYLISGAIVHA